jgi:4-hydroxy-tetrahydrodipicolinate synthase
MADKISLPMFLYNMPSLTDINFELSTIESLMSHPKIVGLKDSSGNMVYFHKVRQLVSRDPKFSLFMGPEELLPEAILAGAHGGVCGGANLAPQLYVRLYEAAVAGDLPLVRKLQDRVLKISSSIYAVGRSSSSYLAGLKCAMACLGICEDHLEEPLRCLSRKDRAQIQQNVNALALEFPAERANLLKFPKSN